MTVHQVMAVEAVILRGTCYDVEVIRPALTNQNTFTLCIDEGRVSSRIIFSNPQSLPAVCYQSGLAEMGDTQRVQIKLERGYCDNSRGMSPDQLSCVTEEPGNFRCHGPNGELLLEHVWDLR
jgi:hypothetical protein